MKIRVSYREYKHNEEATAWSQLGGYIAGYGFFLMIGMAYVLIEGFHIPDMLSIILPVALYIASIIFCSRQEKKARLRHIPSSAAAAQLSKEEQMAVIRELLREYHEKNGRA